MQHPYDMKNVRMPRACKGKKKQPDQPPQKRGRKRKSDVMEEMFQEQLQNARYNTQAQVPEHNAHFSIQDQRNMVNRTNQVLYPNMLQNQNSAAYPMPQQRPQCPSNGSAMTEQPVGTRYNTRRSVHNLPVNTAPTREICWNTSSRPPVTQYDLGVQQMNTPAPVECPMPPQKAEKYIQTEFTLNAEEIAFIKSLRARNVDPDEVRTILENGDYIVTYDEIPAKKTRAKADTEPKKQNENGENNTCLQNETYNQLVSYSNIGKSTLLSMAYAIEWQKKAIGLVNTVAQQQFDASRAIEYQPMPQPTASTGQTCTPPACMLGSEEQEAQNQQNLQVGASVQEIIGENFETMNFRTTPTQQKMAQPRTMPPVAQYQQPIENIANFYNTSCRYAQQNPGEHLNRMPNIPANFLEAAANIFESRFWPNPRSFQQFGFPRCFPRFPPHNSLG